MHNTCGKVTAKKAKVSKPSSGAGGDGVVRLEVEIKGGNKKKEGVFEYIIEPDGKTVNHRLFRPKL